MPKPVQFGRDGGKFETSSESFPFRQVLDKPSEKDHVVLVMVDDDEEDCMLVKEAIKLACLGCTFRCVGDGEQLLDYLHHSSRFMERDSCPFPDLILLDLNMPRMGGREVLKTLKSDPRFRSIPVIILTTSRDLEDVKTCYQLGANSYMTKQPTFDGVVSCVKTLMEYWIEVATLPERKRREPSGGPCDFS